VEERYGGRQALERELRRSSMTYEDLRLRNREVTRNRLYSTRIVQAFIRPRVELLDNEVREYYEENLDQIPSRPTLVDLAVILQAPQPDEETARAIQQKLDAIRQGLQAGRSFDDLAREYSEGPNASRGGLVGTFGRGDLFSRVLEDVAWELPVGEVSPPVTTELGVHLVKLDEKTETEITLRQIMFRIEITEADRAEARRRAQRIAELARAGDQEFAELARNLSDDIESRENGGVIGEVPLDQLREDTREVVSAMEVGEISDPVPGSEGFYVFELLGRSDGEAYSFEEVEDRLRTMLLNQKMEEELQSYLDELREDFFIEIKA
jgi:peptidyl-prolyl cis-trans isomerase SurA